MNCNTINSGIIGMKQNFLKKDNFTYLLASLIVLLFSGAYAAEFSSHFIQEILIEITILTMLVSVFSIQSSRYLFIVCLVLVFFAVMLNITTRLLGKTELEIIQLILLLLFFLLILKPTSEQALFSDEITMNNIFGSICIFLLLGFIWAISYLLIAEMIPNAFSGIEFVSWEKNLPDFIYFSFVVLTTLGFGDLLPISPLARFLVYIESVVGVFYMAIVVSSLVSAKLSSKTE